MGGHSLPCSPPAPVSPWAVPHAWLFWGARITCSLLGEEIKEEIQPKCHHLLILAADSPACWPQQPLLCASIVFVKDAFPALFLWFNLKENHPYQSIFLAIKRLCTRNSVSVQKYSPPE